MITLELAEVEVDYCTVCGGIWLDAGELELLLADAEQTKELLDSFKIDSDCAEKRRKCPICLKRMQKIIVGPSRPVLLLDKCPKGDGLWFDRYFFRMIPIFLFTYRGDIAIKWLFIKL
jgi:Zn-finger nucleic acid-binding protein